MTLVTAKMIKLLYTRARERGILLLLHICFLKRNALVDRTLVGRVG